MIEVQHLTRKYGDHYAVADVSFTAEPGQIYGFLGPNGAGKSTTMNMMTGYLAPTSGTVLIDGEDIMREPEAARARIGYLPEIPPVYADMTVYEYLRFAAELRKVPRKDRGAAIERVMQATDVVSMRDRLIKNLSKGYKQRVGLAQAIIANPPIIILDEPTAGLDPEQQREMFDYIRALKADHTIILSSHILSDISAVCDYVWILNEGRLVASDTPENLQRHMTTTQTIKISVQMCDADAFKAALESIPHIVKITVNGASSDALEASIETDTTEDLRPQISQKVFENGMVILSMSTEEKTLEDVFLALTHEEVQA